MGVFNIDGQSLLKEKVRICAFNVGNFSGGSSGTPAGTDTLYNQFVQTFRDCHADIYMFPEWDVNWNNSELSKDVFGFLKPYHSTFCRVDDPSQTYMGLMNYSSYAFDSEYYEWYTHDSNRYFLDNTAVINGKEVHLICVHFALDTKAHAVSEMQQVLNYISNQGITSYVIAGDMNLGLGSDVTDRIPAALEEITLLESLGGQSLQGSGWGLKNKSFLFNTVEHGGYDHTPSGRFGPYDNFIVSPDIRIDHMELVITEASDHDALCIDLIV